MKNATAVLVAILLCAPYGWGQAPGAQRGRPGEAREPAAQEPQGVPDADVPGDLPDLISVPAGTHVPLVIVRAPQDSQAREGDKVYLRTRVSLRAGGQVMIPARALVVAVLSPDSGSAFGGGQGHNGMSLRLRSVTLPDNERVVVSGRVLGIFGPSKTASGTPSASGFMPGLSAEQLTTVGSFAAAGGALGAALGKDSKGATVGALVGAGIGMVTVLASNGSHVHMLPGTNVEAVLDQPLALDQPPNQ